MSDLIKQIEFEVAFSEGKDKSIKALTKQVKTAMQELQKTIAKQEKDLDARLSDGRGTKRVSASIEKNKSALKELGDQYKKLSIAANYYATEEIKKKQDQIKFQKEFNKLLKEETAEIKKQSQLRKASMNREIYDSQRNRKSAAREQRFASRIERSARYQVMRDELADIQINRKRNAYEDQFQGQYSNIEQGYLERRARDRQLQRSRGAKSNLGSDYFAEDGSVTKLKGRLDELKGLRDLKAPGSAGFKSLSSEIETTEKQLGKLTNRMNNDGMASFRKFSHMVFNLTGLFFIASTSFQGLVKVLTRGAEFDTMRQAFQGTTKDIENMHKASRGLLSMEKIFAFSNKASDLGIKIKDQPIFIDMAIRSMKAYGGGVEKLDEILEKVIKSTETAQKELSSLGIKKVDFSKKVNELSKSLVQNNSKYELVNKSLEKSKKVRKDYLLELDAEDQKTVKVKALLDLYGKTLKDVIDVEQTRPDLVMSINAQFENFTNVLGQKLLPVAAQVFPLITDFMGWITVNSTSIATAIGVISAAMLGLAPLMFSAGNPLGGIAAALSGIILAIVAFETAFPTAASKIITANNEISTSIKDIEGSERNLREIREDAAGEYSKAQQEEIKTNELLIKQAKEKLRIETGNKFSALDQGISEAMSGKLSALQQLQVGATGLFADLANPSSGFGWMKMLQKDAELVAQNLAKSSGELKKFSLEMLGAVRDGIKFGQVVTVTSNLSAALLRNAGLADDLKVKFGALGNAGKAAFWGINLGILKSESAMKQFAKVNELFVKAIELSQSQDPAKLQMASALFAAISGAVNGMQSAFNQSPADEKLPGSKTTGKKEKGADLQTVDDKLRLILDKYNTWLERQKAVNNLIDDIGTLATQQVPAGTALDYMNKVLTPTEGEIKLPEALKEILKLQDEEIENVKKNTKEKLSEAQQDERIAAIKRRLGEAYANIIASQTEKIKESTRAEIEQIKVLEQKVSMQEAIRRVGDSMRDASKPWNPGIKNVMTFFEMSEIGVRSLADTITGELGEAWDNVFGEANSLFEKFLKNVTTKILETLVTRGIGLLLSVLFPGVGTILGAGLNAAVGGRPSGGGGRGAGRSISPTFNPPMIQPIVHITSTMDEQKFFSKNAVVYYRNKKEANAS